VEVRGKHILLSSRIREPALERVVVDEGRWMELDELLVDAVQQPGVKRRVR